MKEKEDVRFKRIRREGVVDLKVLLRLSVGELRTSTSKSVKMTWHPEI